MKKLILGLLLFCGIATADEKTYEFYIEHLPAVCGSHEEVLRYADDRSLIQLNYSLGRENSVPDGEPVFFVTYWVNEEVTQTMATINVPDSDQTCILYISFDVVHNENLLKKEKRIKR